MRTTRAASSFDDIFAALTIACGLTAVWAVHGWANLVALRLPDPDDMMRLQQIRDWLDGQRFADLTQYRLGPGGTAMHWSRLDDLVPAAIIWTLQHVVGRHVAEVAAVIAWPALLLAAAIGLSGRIARRVGGPEITAPAMIIAAIAFPATTLFVPGRIDHHGLQLVLLLVAVVALLRRPSARAGVTGGVATVLSLIVGMETAPILVAAATVAFWDWIAGRDGATRRLAGFGFALAAGTFLASFAFRTLAWNYPACDGFTALSARAMMIASSATLVPVLARSAKRREVRAGFAAISALIVAAGVAAVAPQCLSPYGAVPPVLRQLWLSRVTEAQPLAGASVSLAIAYTGLMFAGIGACAWQAWHVRGRGWTTLLVLQLVASVLTFVQLRGSYAGALLAAPALAALVTNSRSLGVLARIAASCLSAGMLYPIAAQAMARTPTPTGTADCTAPDVIAALSNLPVGMVAAPVDTAAPAIAFTHQRLLAGAYHRDGKGNLAMYAFFLGTPDHAHGIATRLNIRWVVACDGFGGVAAPFASTLENHDAPPWLRPVARLRSGTRIFEVVD